MTPNNNNYFVIIIRIFFCQPCFLSENTDFFTFFLPASSLLFIESMISQTIYIMTCICSARAPFIEAIYSNIIINSLAFLFVYAICNHFGNFYFLHGIGIGVFSPFSIQ